MAKIVLAPEAPDDVNSVSLANATLDEFPSETNDPEIIGNATSHPWLEVESDADEAVATYREASVDPTTDPLSAANPAARLPFDVDAVKAAEEAKDENASKVALDAGKDQDEAVTEGGLAETLAAFNDTPPPPPANDDAGDAS